MKLATNREVWRRVQKFSGGKVLMGVLTAHDVIWVAVAKTEIHYQLEHRGWDKPSHWQLPEIAHGNLYLDNVHRSELEDPTKPPTPRRST